MNVITSSPSPASVSLQNNVDLLVHSGTPEIPSSAPPEPMLDESHCATLATISPAHAPPPLPPPSAPDIAAVGPSRTERASSSRFARQYGIVQRPHLPTTVANEYMYLLA
ncbi:hypothetical protein V8E53_001643 [Lactarius tabidus]